MPETTLEFNSAYKKLNDAQKIAVDTIEGPVLVLAGPGTGKTQVLTTRIANILKETDTAPESILALTYTDAATREMKERLIKLIGKDGYYVKVATYHSFCDDIINENPEKFSKSSGMHKVTDLEKIQIAKEILEKGSFLLLKPAGDPTHHLNSILDAIGDLKREGYSVEKYKKLVNSLKDEFENEKGDLKKGAFIEKEKLVNKNLDLLDIYGKYQTKLTKIGRYDFEDMINWVVDAFEKDPDFLLGYQEKYQYILGDEYQDTNNSQNRLIFALASYWGTEANVFVVGDPHQCLPGKTKIETNKGAVAIKDIRRGDSVLSAVGKGYTSFIKVTKTFKQTKKAKQITFTTESGKQLTVTDNHKMFCFVPPREITKYWYNYLMYKEGVGWRLGITRGLSVRLKVESGADKIVGISCHNSELEARCAETIYSLKYQIPTIVFQARNGMISREYIDKVFKEFDTVTSAHRLASDLGINLNEPHYMREATTRGRGRVKINFMMCNRGYRSKYNKAGFLEHPEVIHEINIQTSNKKILKKISDLGFKLRNKNIGLGFRITSIDIKHLYQIAEKLEKELPGFIDIKSSIGTSQIQHKPARVMQAGNVLIGNYLPVLYGHEIKYERIISRSDKIKKETVYDLEVSPSHNFIANGIVVHNSIFRFQGASKENVKEFQKRFPKHTRIVLDQNYRSTQTLLDAAAGVIKETPLNHNVKYNSLPVKIAKFSSPLFEDEFIIDTIKRKIINGADAKDFAIITIDNADIENLVNLFKSKGLPYRLESGVNILTTPLISQFLKIISLVTSFQDKVNDLDLFIVLNYPYFKLNPLSVLKISRFADERNESLMDTLLDAHPEIDDDVINVFHQFLSWNSKAASHTLPEMFQIIFQESGLLDYILALPQPILELNRFGTLFDDVKQQAEAFPGLDLFGYVINLQTMDENGIKVEEKELINNQNAVTLTTVYKAKGQEWKTVFIYRFVESHWSNKAAKRNIKLPPGILALEETDKEDKNAEERRVFYVALTRAKKNLYLTGSTQYPKSKKMIFPSMFLDEIPKETFKYIKVGKYQKNAAKILGNLMSIPPAPVLHDGEKEYLKEIIKNLTLSPTSLNKYLECHYKFKLDNLYRIPRTSPAAMNFGTAVHSALELLYTDLKNNGKLESKENFIKDFVSSLRHQVLSEADFKNYLEKGQKILSAYYDNYKDTFTPALFVEKDFGKSLTSQIILDDIPLTGKADRIDLTNKEEKHVRFIDYKTGQIKTRNEIEGLTQSSEGEYKRQLVFYQLLADLDRSFGYKVVQTELQFIEPDKNGKFHQERFNIQKEEVEDLKKLLRKTVASIRALDFSRTENKKHCDRCEFRSHCWPEGLPITTPEAEEE